MGWAGILFLVIGLLIMAGTNTIGGPSASAALLNAKTNLMIAGGALFVGGAAFMGARHIGETIATLIAHMRDHPMLVGADVPVPADFKAERGVSDEQSAKVGRVTMAEVEKRKTKRNILVLVVLAAIVLIGGAFYLTSMNTNSGATAPAETTSTQ